MTLIADFEIRVNGTRVRDDVSDLVEEIVVDQHVRLPDSVSVRIVNPGELLDGTELAIGASIEILFSPPDSDARSGVFDGEITALEPEFDERGCTLTLRGYDRLHRLNRTTKTDTYQSMSYSDIARKVFSGSGLTAGTIDSTDALDFVQQSNETDWDFLWRLAREVDFELVVDGRKASFRRAGTTQGTAVEATLGDDLLVFRPRLTGMQQVDEVIVRGWDPRSAQAIVGNAPSPALSSTIGQSRAQLASALGGGTVTVLDHPLSTQGQATALAKSVAAQLGNAFVEGEGVTTGEPKLRAGGQIKVKGVGERFGGTYTLTQATHLFRPRDGYRTRFTISGRTARTLLGAPAPSPQRFARTIVAGIVTNNSDPDGLGRVRVRCPDLTDTHEGWWARVASPSAGTERGVLMLPVAGDEVLLGFAHAQDNFPYVLGSLWNGTAKPGALVHQDGSFALKSDHQIAVEAKEAIAVTGRDTIGLTADKDITVKASGRLDQQATQGAKLASDATVEIDAQTNIKLAAQVNLEAQATLMKLAAQGQIQVSSDGAIQIQGAVVEIQANGVLKLSAPQIMLG